MGTSVTCDKTVDGVPVLSDQLIKPCTFTPLVNVKQVEELPLHPPKAPEQDCEELEDKLLEGALKNLDYFPQLFREVQRVKTGKKAENMPDCWEQPDMKKFGQLKCSIH